MLQPRRIKYRKMHRGRRRGKAQGGNQVNFGEFGMKAMGVTWLTARQIESARRAIVRHLRRGGQLWIRVFPDKPITEKPLETRMGSGKGNVEGWVAVVKPGRILFELAGVREEVAREAFRKASHKLPIDVRMVYREETVESAAGVPL